MKWKAADLIREREKRKLYKKVNGRYVEANDMDCYEGLREGWWLVWVKPGGTSMRSVLCPDNAEIEAAMMEAEDKIVDILSKAVTAKPRKKEIPVDFARAWQRMVEKYGDEMSLLHYDSLYDVAKNILKAVLDRKK